jgi:hypothetical protein
MADQFLALPLDRRLLRCRSRIAVAKAATQGLRTELEREFELQLRGFLHRWYRSISAGLRSSGFYTSTEAAARLLQQLATSSRDLKERSDELLQIALEPLQDELLKSRELQTLVRYLRIYDHRMYDLGAVTGLKTIGVTATSSRIELSKRRLVSKAAGDFEFSLTDTELVAALENRATVVGAGITADLVGDVRRLVRDNVFLGNQSTTEIARTVAAASGIPQWRALKIARTEAQVAFNSALAESYRRSGVKKITWITVGDNRVREGHQDNDGATVEIGKSFPNGQVHPGDGVDSINCRCSISADLSDPNILLKPWDGSSGPFLKGPDTLALKARLLAKALASKDKLPRTIIADLDALPAAPDMLSGLPPALQTKVAAASKAQLDEILDSLQSTLDKATAKGSKGVITKKTKQIKIVQDVKTAKYGGAQTAAIKPKIAPMQAGTPGVASNSVDVSAIAAKLPPSLQKKALLLDEAGLKALIASIDETLLAAIKKGSKGVVTKKTKQSQLLKELYAAKYGGKPASTALQTIQFGEMNVISKGKIKKTWISQAEKAWDGMPPQVLDTLDDAGVTPYLVEDVTDALPSLAGKKPPGWPPGTTWSEANGAYHMPTQKVVFKHSSNNGVMYHEAGHAWDDALKVSDSSSFKSAFQQDLDALDEAIDAATGADKAKLLKLEQELSYYLEGPTARKEALAELFAAKINPNGYGSAPFKHITQGLNGVLPRTSKLLDDMIVPPKKVPKKVPKKPVVAPKKPMADFGDDFEAAWEATGFDDKVKAQQAFEDIVAASQKKHGYTQYNLLKDSKHNKKVKQLFGDIEDAFDDWEADDGALLLEILDKPFEYNQILHLAAETGDAVVDARILAAMDELANMPMTKLTDDLLKDTLLKAHTGAKPGAISGPNLKKLAAANAENAKPVAAPKLVPPTKSAPKKPKGSLKNFTNDHLTKQKEKYGELFGTDVTAFKKASAHNKLVSSKIDQLDDLVGGFDSADYADLHYLSVTGAEGAIKQFKNNKLLKVLDDLIAAGEDGVELTLKQIKNDLLKKGHGIKPGTKLGTKPTATVPKVTVPTGPIDTTLPKPVKEMLESLKPYKNGALKGPYGYPTLDELSDLKDIKGLGGSTGARLVEDANGNRYVLKKGSSAAHLREEVYADELYYSMMVKTPRPKLYETVDGPIKLTRYQDDAQELGKLLKSGDKDAAAEALKTVNKNFASDALLGNWDVAGENLDNILISKRGDVLRIDNGGALRFRAMGGAKGDAFGDVVGELESLRDFSKNPQSAKIFQGLDDHAVAEQIDKLVKDREYILSFAPNDLRELLAKRLQYMEEWAKRVRATKARVNPTNPRSVWYEPPIDSRIPTSSTHGVKVEMADLTADDLEGIHDYTGNGFYKKLNENLYGGGKMTDMQLGIIDNVDNALRKLPEYEGTTWRGVTMEGKIGERFGEAHQPGNVVAYNGYLSASDSAGAEFSGNYRLIIKSKTGRNIKKLSAMGESEAEVLYGRGSHFIVDRVEDTRRSGRKVTQIYMTEIE